MLIADAGHPSHSTSSRLLSPTAAEPPKTLTKEWKVAQTERAREAKMDPWVAFPLTSMLPCFPSYTSHSCCPDWLIDHHPSLLIQQIHRTQSRRRKGQGLLSADACSLDHVSYHRWRPLALRTGHVPTSPCSVVEHLYLQSKVEERQEASEVVTALCFGYASPRCMMCQLCEWVLKLHLVGKCSSR